MLVSPWRQGPPIGGIPAREGPEFPQCLVVVGEPMSEDVQEPSHLLSMAWKKGVALKSPIPTKSEYCAW